ncbi:MAG: hypothetical protein QXU81_10350 [Candidatus Bathyarchaeia archaeon]
MPLEKVRKLADLALKGLGLEAMLSLRAAQTITMLSSIDLSDTGVKRLGLWLG